MIVRPGSSTANAVILREAQKAGVPMVDLPRIWRGRVTHADLTAAAGSQAINLRTLFAATNPIPEDIMVGEYNLDLVEVVAGGLISAATAILGETSPVNDTDGYVTSTDVFTGATLGWKDTPAAALYTPRFRATSTPILTVATTGANVVAATSGIIDVYLRYRLMPNHRAA